MRRHRFVIQGVPRLETIHRMVRRTVSWVGRTLAFGMVLVAAWLLGLISYVETMPERVEDQQTRTDAIVVLTGGSERVSTGLDLLRQGRADVLFVSGVFPETRLETLLRDEAGVEDLRNRVFLGHVAADTIGNAIETAIWMREHHWRSIRLVTANYHMRRSLLEFEAAMPGVQIIPHPVFPPKVKWEEWWHYPGTAALFATEYSKYLAARLRLLFPDTPASGWSR